MRVLTYNVHSCVGIDGQRSYERVAAVLAELAPDVIALQELDHRRLRSAQVHQAEILAGMLMMDFHFHPALRIAEEEYGDAILSRYPLRVIKAGELPTVETGLYLEKRGALWVEVVAEGRRWQIFNTHFGLGRKERLIQAEALMGPSWIGAVSKDDPVVVCGDFNSQAGGRVYRFMCKSLQDSQGGRCRRTFPSHFPVLAIDHVFVSAGVRVERVEVHGRGPARKASDHLPLVVDLA